MIVTHKAIKSVLKPFLLFVALFAFAVAAYSAATSASADSTDPSYSKVYNEAKKHLGSRYVYGAVGPTHFDCSGFTKYVYKKSIQKSIPRTAQAQYNGTKKVSKKNIQKGDLVYFGGSKHSISHVGMYIGNGRMIDSQNRGVITENVYSPWWHVVGFSRPATLSYDD
ncbi:NlpC/P60 family protein [Lentilactobacillus sp. TOM.63]|uniref:C40 family peptidase n=1 Tax=Lentilactobacillus sp. TOM.63 TaxID=3055077 RepID=UPI0025A2358A|nr:NlpC/P60 family protein [Lentilactobacillus sp. TOM.63]MDM7517400.1 NlpC/P60 family protein [Lentilactobacillus sp. TOM.63]